jgi:protoporphyrinogen oxidase
MRTLSCQACILGTGPAGLGAAVELTRRGVNDLLLVDRHTIVGGLSRTETFGGARFDVGPHRFFTKNQEINTLWRATLGRDFVPVDRLTRIFYRNRFFAYPVRPFDALWKLGPARSAQALFSFAAQTFRPLDNAVTFEEWITRRFGRTLYETFFKTYTEKVWGIPCSQIGAEWAAQRIKGLDIVQVLKNALGLNRGGSIKTLVEQFDYPVRGAGQMYEAMAAAADQAGARFLMNTQVRQIHHRDHAISAVDVESPEGETVRITADHYFSSIPITTFIARCTPPLPREVLHASGALYYRDHITVNLLVQKSTLFPDQWIYVHSPEVRMARIANYANFSPQMAGKSGCTPVSVEYFVFQTEDLWQRTDDELKQLAVDELVCLKLLERTQVAEAWVVRETESYPTYYLGFREHYDVVRSAVTQFANLLPIGRGGLYKYNNQDHSTLSGLLAARASLDPGAAAVSPWDVNTDDEYLEQGERK